MYRLSAIKGEPDKAEPSEARTIFGQGIITTGDYLGLYLSRWPSIDNAFTVDLWVRASEFFEMPSDPTLSWYYEIIYLSIDYEEKFYIGLVSDGRGIFNIMDPIEYDYFILDHGLEAFYPPKREWHYILFSYS